MTDAAARIQRAYLTITLLSTLAASFIWGVNTLFLLDAGLSNAQAFGANAFFTVGQVVFEVPTGVVADTWGRRASFLLGVATLFVATLLYLVMWQIEAPFWGWALSSIVIGLGFTFFSGAVEAWLVDALDEGGFTGDLESVFGRGQTVTGAAMLTGSVVGGLVAQLTNLGVPYVLRAVVLAVTFAVAWRVMHDIGFEAEGSEGIITEVRTLARASIDVGWRQPAIRWLMLAAPITSGVGIYAFYALQPYLLELYGDPEAFAVAGIAAAIVAGAQMIGGLAVPFLRRRFARRTHALLLATAVSTAALLLIGLTGEFWVAIVLLTIWAMTFAAAGPMRQAFVNGLIPSRQRATVLSFDALMGSAGGVASQPALGRVADVQGYSASYAVAAAVQVFALPFVYLARRADAPSDPIAERA